MPTVKVLQEDIDSGIARKSNKCPIAVAFGRTFPDVSYVSIDLQSIRATRQHDGSTERVVWMTPRKAQQFIVAFDYGDTNLQEFSFQLRNPQVTVGKPIKGESNKPTLSAPLSPRVPPTKTGGRTPPKPRGIATERKFGLRGLRDNRPPTDD